MIYDLFTRADFCYSKFSFLNIVVWFLGFLWFFWRLKLYFFAKSRIKRIFSFLLKWHIERVGCNEFKRMKGSYLLVSGLFIIILGRNIWGLFPYIFGVTTQIVVTSTLSIVIWLCIVSSSLEFSPSHFFAHLTPQGSPGLLAPVLNLIEIVRNIIRPLTLALRLRINMATGHVLISLMSTRGVFLMFPLSILLFFLILLVRGYLLFEIGICFIQGFVFRLLRVNYLMEHT